MPDERVQVERKKEAGVALAAALRFIEAVAQAESSRV
jgi:hypothetical protein